MQCVCLSTLTKIRATASSLSKDIAQRQSISKKYLEQIVPALTAEGVLKDSRGFQGGYRLAASRRISR